jgi:PAS domain S-box-containing protein
MKKKTTISTSNEIILYLKGLAKKKEKVRRNLAKTAAKLAATAKKLAITAREKENVRRELAKTAEKLAFTAKKLAITARKKESIKRKLAITAAKLAVTAEKLAVTAIEKENARRELAKTAAMLAVTANNLTESVRHKLIITAEKLAVLAGEKEDNRRKLVITAEKLALTAREKEDSRRKLAIVATKLAVTAREKENVRKKLAIVAKKLKTSHETLEKKVLERTNDLEMARVKEEAILLSIGDGLIVTDKEGNIIIINKTAEKLLGKRSKEVVGKIITKTINLENEKGLSVPPEKHPVNIVLKTDTKASGSTYYYVRKDKTKFPMAIMATPVIFAGEVIGAIKIFRDITYEREIDKAKTEFVSLASHQLRTPLSTVNWYTEMLLEGDLGELNEKQKKYLNEVYRGNQRMVELVNALLDVASLELGTFAIEPEQTDICVLIKNVIEEQKLQINTRKIQFSFLCEEKILLMQTDPKLIHMVVQNILSNAIKYTPLGGQIDLSLKLADKNNIEIKISDTGYGIPKNQQKKIFTKLFRADNVRDKDTDGTGLGLYIAKSIVENSGGKIWFSSPGEKRNSGTTFYVTLPLNRIKESTK